MIRPAIVSILLFLSVFMMRGVATDWRKGALDSPEPPDKKTAQGSGAAAPSGVPATKPLQPKAPANLPDLKIGYVFNQERMLGSAEPVAEAQHPDEEGGAYNPNAQGISASIDEITFAGSIIADGFRRALILFPAATESRPAQQPAPKSSKSKGPAPAGGGEEHAQLELGDTISGYQVAEILPDKLIFSKGEETVEKLLFDPAKKRQAPPMRPGGAGGPPGGGAPPRPPTPGGVLSTTIGGTGAPANPAEAAGGSVPPPAPANPAAPGTPPTEHAQPPASSASGSTPAAAQQTPTRRMVISRQTSPAPDTSKVVRQSRSGDEAVPMPPGINAGEASGGDDSVAMPPMPGGN